MTASRKMRWRRPVLVLDTDRVGGEQAAEVLVGAGLEVELLHRPEDLLQRSATHPSTVIVVEVPLDGMSESVLLSTTQRMTGLKVMPVVLTSRTYSEDCSVAKSLLAQGAVDFVSRPASSQRWRSAIARALAKLQNESAKLASLNQKTSNAGFRGPAPEVSIPPVGGAATPPSPDTRSSSPPRKGRRSHPASATRGAAPTSLTPGKDGRTASEVLSPARRKELEGKGFKAPGDAIAGAVMGSPGPVGATLVWRADETTISLACIDHAFELDSEVRLTFVVRDPDGNRDAKPRILGRVVESHTYPWGNLAEISLMGAAPQVDYDRLVEAVAESGGWALDWNKTGWTVD